MTYSIVVKVANGQPEAIVSGDAPDGSYQIDGHRSDAGESVQVTRRDAEGRYAAHAEHHPRS